MHFLTKDEITRLLTVAKEYNSLHHLAILVGLLHGLRVSEALAIQGHDVADGKLAVKRLKKSRPTLHALRIDADPVFDASPLLALAVANPDTLLFDWTRQYMDRIFKQYCALAGIHSVKAHYHVLKHSICVLIWNDTHDLNAIQDRVGHKNPSSTLVYMRTDASAKAESVVNSMSFGAVAVGA